LEVISPRVQEKGEGGSVLAESTIVILQLPLAGNAVATSVKVYTFPVGSEPKIMATSLFPALCELKAQRGSFGLSWVGL
jgi:hypothetical protein